MRILHVVPSFGLGGMEKIISEVINARAGCHNHTVLPLDGCTQASEWIKDTKTSFINFDKPRSRSLFFSSLYGVLRASDPELLMTYNWGATDAIWLGRLAGIQKILHHEHGFNVDEGAATIWTRDCLRLLVYRLACKIVVVSQDLKQMMRRRFFIAENKVIRIPNGIDASYYSPNDIERHRLRKSFGYGDAQCVFGFSGRLDPVKNLNLLLDVFSACRPDKNGLRLLIVGDGPDLERLKARCREEKIHPYVVFAGQQQDVLPYLRAMDVFVLTSLREQMPLTVLEAMAVGLPIVATRVGEIPYMVEEGVEGFVRDLHVPLETFVQVFQSLFCRTTRRGLGDAARQKVLAKFNRDAMLQSYRRLIAEFE